MWKSKKLAFLESWEESETKGKEGKSKGKERIKRASFEEKRRWRTERERKKGSC